MRFHFAASLIASPLIAAPLMGFLCSGPVHAQQDGLVQQFNDIRDAAGLGKDRGPIDFTERPPLVVPPSYTLPPPSSGDDGRLGVNDPDVTARRKALADPRRPVPPIDPGASATGLDARRYLVEPPSGLRDPARVAADITTDRSASAGKAAGEGRHKHRHRTHPKAAGTGAEPAQ